MPRIAASAVALVVCIFVVAAQATQLLPRPRFCNVRTHQCFCYPFEATHGLPTCRLDVVLAGAYDLRDYEVYVFPADVRDDPAAAEFAADVYGRVRNGTLTETIVCQEAVELTPTPINLNSTLQFLAPNITVQSMCFGTGLRLHVPKGSDAEATGNAIVFSAAYSTLFGVTISADADVLLQAAINVTLDWDPVRQLRGTTEVTESRIGLIEVTAPSLAAIAVGRSFALDTPADAPLNVTGIEIEGIVVDPHTVRTGMLALRTVGSPATVPSFVGTPVSGLDVVFVWAYPNGTGTTPAEWTPESGTIQVLNDMLPASALYAWNQVIATSTLSTLPSAAAGHLTLYVGLGCGGAVVLLLIVVCVVCHHNAKRDHKRRNEGAHQIAHTHRAEAAAKPHTE